MAQIEYYVRAMPGAGWYEVAKFEGGDAPTHVYDVNGDDCTCLGRYQCKHTRLVAEFRRMGEPWMTTFWMEENKWAWYRLMLPIVDPLAQRRKRKRK